ncbi:lanthionine synthetase C family protein [Actinoplanes sp. NBC_00393]|uniref:lanthionine synthetase C family protein n=1 Tax=Actinoplanes sp. NBC_00393 TaxID=2975953 RepID=UPI002E1ECFE3
MTEAVAPIARTEAEAAAQSLSSGAAGDALLAIERASSGAADWNTARQLIKQATARGVDSARHAGLFYGLPAITFMLHRTSADGRERYVVARRDLDRHVRRLTRKRLRAAEQRARTGTAASFAEYDLFAGLGGLGILLLHTQPGTDELRDVLRHLVRLTEPRRSAGLTVPGWWVDHHPDPILPTPGGHANNGMAHGAAGVLAVLAHATRHQLHVDGQADAIARLCTWFDHWRQHSPHGPWWPQWLTRDQLRTGDPGDSPPRPSWCYGAAGIGRALQLAALAAGDHTRRREAEDAIAACLTDTQIDRLAEPGICHGLAGLYQTAARAAADAATPLIGRRLPALAARLTATAPGGNSTFLTGNTGVAIVTETIRTGQPPSTRWDQCLLIT